MSTYRTREELRDLVIRSFAKESEITAIYLFGKEVTNMTDEYSDLDVIICSNDLAATHSKYQRILSEISPIRGSFLLNTTEHDLSQMVMMRDFSPYQKIDFSIVDSLERKIEAGFGPFIPVYVKDTDDEGNSTKLKILDKDPIRSQMDDVLFAIPRFTKCLFRKDYDMYRRWKNSTDLALVLLYEKYFGWAKKTERKQVPAKEMAKLNQRMSKEDFRVVNKIFPDSGALNLAESYRVCVELLISLCIQKACFFEAELDEAFIWHMEKFLGTEISRFKSL